MQLYACQQSGLKTFDTTKLSIIVFENIAHIAPQNVSAILKVTWLTFQNYDKHLKNNFFIYMLLHRVINTVYLNKLYLLISPIHGVSLLEKTNHQLVHKNNKDMFS